MISAIRLSEESVGYAVSQGSDIAECMGLKGIQGAEGTIQRWERHCDLLFCSALVAVISVISVVVSCA